MTCPKKTTNCNTKTLTLTLWYKEEKKKGRDGGAGGSLHQQGANSNAACRWK